MQFLCESCKTTLQIADEKVRGKRLVVRCKRCGNRIAITDPLLNTGPLKVKPAPAPTPAAAPPRPQPEPQPSVAAPAAAEASQPSEPDTDTESTRAMDSDVLERALQASKADEPPAPEAPRSAPPPAVSAPPPALPIPPPAAAVPAVPRDPAIWFAMLSGKQTGPLSRAEVGLRTAQGQIGPRTYVWKEGMTAWQRAKEVPELGALFAPPPEPRRSPEPAPIRPAPAAPPPEPRPAEPARAESPKPEPAREPREPAERAQPAPGVQDLFEPVEAGGQSAKDLARWASEEMGRKSTPAAQSPFAQVPDAATVQKPSRDDVSRELMFGRATRRSRAPMVVFIVFALLAAAAILLWVTRGSGEPHAAAQTAAPAQAAATPPAQTPAAAAAPVAPPPTPPEPVSGLTPDQVRRKLDEHKGALQGCVDEALRRDPNLRVGKIHIATTIAPSGKVTAARIDKRTVDESPLGSCLKSATRHIVFPGFTGSPFDVDIPIVVSAGGE